MQVCTLRNVCTSIVRKGTVKICIIKVSTKYTLSILSRRTRLLFCSGCVDSVHNDGWPIISPVPRACLYWNSANTLGVSCHLPGERWIKSAVFPLQHEPAVCVRIVSHRHTATRKNVPGTKSVPAAALSHVPCVHWVCPYTEWFINIFCLRTKRLWSACLQQGCLNSSIFWEIHQKL